jgi:hypothetical protein
MTEYISQHELDQHIQTGEDLYQVKGFPHKGWHLLDCEDLLAPQATCQVYPNHPNLRYVFSIRHDEANLELKAGRQCCSNLTDEKRDDLKRRESLARRKTAQKRLKQPSSNNNLFLELGQYVEGRSTDVHLGGYERRVAMDHAPYHPRYRPGFPPIASDVPWLTREWPWHHTPPQQLLGGVLVLQCPVCGFFYNHHEQITKLDRPYKGWTGDGEWLKVSFMCENWHVWSLNFGFHKGQMYVFATIDNERYPDEDDDANPSPLMDQA